MKLKSLILTLIVISLAGWCIYALVKSRGTDAEPDAAAEPSVVTVQTGTLQRMTLHRYVRGYGTVAAAPATATHPAADAPLAPPSAGVVAKVDVVAGQRVQAGDVLVELNSGAATFAYAQAELARQKQLFAQHNTSLKTVQNAEAQLAALEIVSPLAGTVTRVNVKPGAAVDTTTVAVEVMDLNRLAVLTQIPADQAGDLPAGDAVRIATGPDAPPVTAPLAFVSPAVNAGDGTVSAWAALPAGSGLRPGDFVRLKIVTLTHTNCLAAPAASVVTDENGNQFVARVSGDTATQVPVQTGFSEGDWTEIAGTNLHAGDSVVTVGAYGLPATTQVKIVPAADETHSAPAQ
jgi:multidrug efflux pump subunit AcrA (membrane-fusion protein)